MTLNEFKYALLTLSEVNFKLENGIEVPKHFHITEVGQIDKKFIDCGGTVRYEQKVNFQLWQSVDLWHRLEPAKLLKIIEISQEKIGVENHEIEVEYQSETIGKYSLSFDGNAFVLLAQKTNCLASDQCGIPTEKIKVNLSEFIKKVESCCSPNQTCC